MADPWLRHMLQVPHSNPPSTQTKSSAERARELARRLGQPFKSAVNHLAGGSKTNVDELAKGMADQREHIRMLEERNAAQNREIARLQQQQQHPGSSSLNYALAVVSDVDQVMALLTVSTIQQR